MSFSGIMQPILVQAPFQRRWWGVVLRWGGGEAWWPAVLCPSFWEYILFHLRLKSLAFLSYLMYWHTTSFARSGNWHSSVSILEADCKCRAESLKWGFSSGVFGMITKFLLGLESGLCSQAASIWVLTLLPASRMTWARPLLVSLYLSSSSVK